MRLLIVCLTLLLATMVRGDDWGPLQFLIGHWTGEGSGSPGAGSGAFSFTPDVHDHVLVRRSFAQYADSRHDDLMIVYRESGSLHAIFFDSEGHVIRYGVSASGGGAQFLSDGAATQVRFRLTYSAVDTAHVKLRFEIAPPGKDFATYLEATAHRD